MRLVVSVLLLFLAMESALASEATASSSFMVNYARTVTVHGDAAPKGPVCAVLHPLFFMSSFIATCVLMYLYSHSASNRFPPRMVALASLATLALMLGYVIVNFACLATTKCYHSTRKMFSIIQLLGWALMIATSPELKVLRAATPASITTTAAAPANEERKPSDAKPLDMERVATGSQVLPWDAHEKTKVKPFDHIQEQRNRWREIESRISKLRFQNYLVTHPAPVNPPTATAPEIPTLPVKPLETPEAKPDTSKEKEEAAANEEAQAELDHWLTLFEIMLSPSLWAKTFRAMPTFQKIRVFVMIIWIVASFVLSSTMVCDSVPQI